MDKLQKVKLTLGENEKWFRAIFSPTFGFIGLMQLMGILMEGNQTVLKFSGITSSKVICCPLWEACWSGFSRDVEDFPPYSEETFNFSQTLVGKLTQGLGFLLVFPHNVKIQAQWWTISKEIQAQLQRLITRASRWWTHVSQVKSFSNQTQKVIFLIPKILGRLGIISKVYEKVLVIFKTVENCDRR